MGNDSKGRLLMLIMAVVIVAGAGIFFYNISQRNGPHYNPVYTPPPQPQPQPPAQPAPTAQAPHACISYSPQSPHPGDIIHFDMSCSSFVSNPWAKHLDFSIWCGPPTATGQGAYGSSGGGLHFDFQLQNYPVVCKAHFHIEDGNGATDDKSVGFQAF